MNVVVIGTGLAGLTATALLSKAGHAVTALEQHERIGGVTATLERGGYHWDRGQMLVPDFGPGEPARRISRQPSLPPAQDRSWSISFATFSTG